jgi:cytochrome c-type biogenesis protein CcmH/NrfG
MSFWRKKVIDFALDRQTLQHIAEQRAWIEKDPGNPVPYKNLAQLYRIQQRPDEALGLLLEAVRIRADYAEAHLELAEIYAIRGDGRAAWKHARTAQREGHPRAVDLLRRYAVPET